MGYFDKYQSRILANGNSVGESFENSTVDLINKTFANSPLYRTIQINNIDDDLFTSVPTGYTLNTEVCSPVPSYTGSYGTWVYDSINSEYDFTSGDNFYVDAIHSIPNNILDGKLRIKLRADTRYPSDMVIFIEVREDANNFYRFAVNGGYYSIGRNESERLEKFVGGVSVDKLETSGGGIPSLGTIYDIECQWSSTNLKVLINGVQYLNLDITNTTVLNPTEFKIIFFQMDGALMEWEVVKDVEVRLQRGESSKEKSLLLKPLTTISVGSTFILDGDNWIVVDFDTNDIYPKAKIEKCNNTLTVYGDPTKVYVGDNDFGLPVYNETNGQQYDFPCVVKNYYQKFDSDERFNLPEGKSLITIQSNTDSENNVKLGTKFTIWNEQYEIKGLDRTIEGIITLNAWREV